MPIRESFRQLCSTQLYSLRSRLLLLSTAILLSLVALIAANSNRLLNQAIERNTRQHVDQVAAMLNFSLTPYSTAGSLATIGDFLRELVSVNDQGLIFIGLYNPAGQPVMTVGTAPAGWHADRNALNSLQYRNSSVVVSRPILLEHNRIGTLAFEISTRVLGDTRQTILQQTLGISLLALLAALLLLSVLGYWMTRRLHRLAQACRSIVEQQTLAQLDDSGRDEIALMARALNAMNASIRRRIAELEDAAHEYRGLFDHAALGIARIELDGGIGFCNAKWETTLAGTATSSSYTLAERYPWLEHARQQLCHGTPDDEINTTIHMESAAGIQRYFRLSASLYRSRDGQPRYCIFMIRDVTVETAAAIGQQASSALYRTITETAQEGICLLDAAGTVRYVNRQLAHMFGNGNSSRILGRPLAALLGRTEPNLLQLHGQDVLTHDHRGAELWLMCAISPLPPDATRGYDGHLCMMIDISSRKRAEVQLSHYNEQLEAEVQSRTARLEELNKELEIFSYSISHDLRAPLRAIAGFSAILQENENARLSEDGQQLLQRVIGAAKRMNAQLDGMLQLSRLTRSEIRTEPVDLSAMAESLVAELQTAGQYSADVRIAPTLAAQTDPRLIHAALENLLSNALKYSSKAAAPRIEFGMAQQHGKQAFYVRDNGAGFSMEQAGKLFGLFQRLHNNSEFEGTGVGLASVKRIISRLGGDIWAESSPGNGATFYFTLPTSRINTLAMS